MDQQGQHDWGGAADGAEGDPALRVPKTAELVADHVREQIASGALGAGEYLASEALLCEAFGIARPTLREAMRILESEGLLAISRGARTGARVLRPGLAPMTRHAATWLRARDVPPPDFVAARLALLMAAAELLAERRDRSVIAALHGALAAARRALAAGDEQEAHAQLCVFARLLVEAAGNRTLAMFALVLERLIAEGQPQASRDDLSATLRLGERLLARVAAGWFGEPPLPSWLAETETSRYPSAA